jgi:hypothetical protein
MFRRRSVVPFSAPADLKIRSRQSQNGNCCGASHATPGKMQLSHSLEVPLSLRLARNVLLDSLMRSGMVRVLLPSPSVQMGLPKISKWSRHSHRRLTRNRSQTTFAFGALAFSVSWFLFPWSLVRTEAHTCCHCPRSGIVVLRQTMLYPAVVGLSTDPLDSSSPQNGPFAAGFS